MSEKSKSSDPNTPRAKTTEIPPPRLGIRLEGIRATYANLARGTGTPEEVILDFALNSNAFGPSSEGEIPIDHRIVMSHPTAKRLLILLNEIIRRHENQFGPIEIDVNKRVRSS